MLLKELTYRVTKLDSDILANYMSRCKCTHGDARNEIKLMKGGIIFSLKTSSSS